MSSSAAFHQEKEVGKVYDYRLLLRLLARLRPYGGLAALAVVLLLISSTLQLIGPMATALALDLYVQPGERQASGKVQWVGRQLESAGLDFEPAAGLAFIAAVYLGSLLLSFVILYVQSYVMGLMGQLIMRDLRRDVFAKLQALPVGFLDRHPIGRLITRATTDVASLNDLFTAGFVSIFGDLFLLGGILAVLFLLDWRLALVSFAVLPLLFGLALWFKTRARQSYRQVRVKVAAINAFLQEHIGGMAVMQLFNREHRASEDFSLVNGEHRDANVRAIFYYAVYYPMIEILTALGLALIIGFGGAQILAGTLSLGALVAFLQYAQRFYQPITDLSDKYNILQSAMASAERIFELLDTDLDIVTPPRPYRPEAVRGEIELDKVSFAYKAGEPVLEDLSLCIAPGETVAIVGHTGAGKTTLASLLLRFYDVTSGEVRLDGVDVRRWDLQQLRGAVGMVLQDTFLFAGDLAANIRLGNAAIDDAALAAAAREVRLAELVDAMPDGYATRVRERGAGFSVGQKQLVAFARALAFDPKVLILDEATASVDTETEQRIQEALERLLAGRTSLVIAHRLSTIQRADRILVLHKGRLREQGTHQELLAAGGIYHTLYHLQHRRPPQELATA